MKALAKKRRRNREKWAKATGMELAETPKREPSGRPSRAENGREDRDAPKVALDARCRLMGWQEGDDRAKAQSLEGDTGRAITIAAPNDTARLWRVYAAWDTAETVYFRRILGKARHAKTAKIEMLREKVETRPDDKPDTRDEDEKDRDAVNTWMRWRGYIGRLDGDMQTALHNANLGRVELTSGRALTSHGRKFVYALSKLADVVEGA